VSILEVPRLAWGNCQCRNSGESRWSRNFPCINTASSSPVRKGLLRHVFYHVSWKNCSLVFEVNKTRVYYRYLQYWNIHRTRLPFDRRWRTEGRIELDALSFWKMQCGSRYFSTQPQEKHTIDFDTSSEFSHMTSSIQYSLASRACQSGSEFCHLPGHERPISSARDMYVSVSFLRQSREQT
jgi:hypothetical protein